MSAAGAFAVASTAVTDARLTVMDAPLTATDEHLTTDAYLTVMDVHLTGTVVEGSRARHGEYFEVVVPKLRCR